MLARSIDAETGITTAASPDGGPGMGDAAATLRPGQRVVHRYFGIGTIIEIERGGMKARVRFGDDAASERSLLTRVLSPLA